MRVRTTTVVRAALRQAQDRLVEVSSDEFDRAPMSSRLMSLVWALLGVLLTAAGAFPAHALTPDQVRAMVIGENETRATAIAQVASSGDPRAQEFFQALLDDAVKTSADKVFIVRDGKAQ